MYILTGSVASKLQETDEELTETEQETETETGKYIIHISHKQDEIFP